ncbi:nitrate/nitrite transporter NarK [Mycoplana sp. BE70]|uniref:hypothetical protein n=1 Tax=Mycoplana sp. BE70 TaxID=2817775 RepID=UPI00285816CD|nr:hypothetical protein [Mycoplana sp. BE70]MDR6759244.1 nitrate/nitrite transporter NarK [Mycoplana sp. BE70]
MSKRICWAQFSQLEVSGKIMKFVVIGLLCLAVGGCSQTSSGSGTAVPTREKSAAVTAGMQKPKPKRKTCEEAIQAQSNAAMLGGALGMVGSFGGFGGRGGMVASQAASTAGTMVATSQSAKVQSGGMQECY